MNFGIGNVKGAGGGSGNSGTISLTRTFEATIGCSPELGFLADAGLPEIVDKTYGEEYVLGIAKVSVVSQITWGIPLSISKSASPSTNFPDKGGNNLIIYGSSSFNVYWEDFVDEQGNTKKIMKFDIGNSSWELAFYPKQIQMSSNAQNGTLKMCANVDLILFNTDTNEYEIYQTGDLEKTSNASNNANQYLYGCGLFIDIPKKYLLIGAKVNHLYYDYPKPQVVDQIG